MKNVLDCLKKANARIAQNDQLLREELQARRDLNLEGFAHESMADSVDLGLPGGEPAGGELALETIVLRTGRPVLAVHDGEAVLDLDESDSRTWRKRLEDSMENVRRVTAAVGRVELTNHPQFEWAGTAWLIDEEIVVTNRHVAELFGRAANGAFVFRMGMGGLPMAARIDFLEEFGSPKEQEFALEKILHIEPGNGPDVAFLRVRQKGQKKLAAHIPLFDELVASGQDVAVVGYPAKDTRIPDLQLMISIFGEVFDKKRLAPGKVTGVNEINILHDCSTLGGNSGSVVFDLATGKAVALHYAGRFLDANFSVPAKVIANRLKRITAGETVIARPTPVVAPSPSPVPAAQTAPARTASAAPQTMVQRVDLHFTLPVEIAIQVGQPVTGRAAQPVSAAVQAPAEDVDELVTEAPVESYRGRPGFDPEFLGEGLAVPLPKVIRNACEVLEFRFDNVMATELKYQHFSVVMNRARRLCFFSAANIDGLHSKRTTRKGWRRDSRIPETMQIQSECYGNPPRFSRGHMTRREDPAWGPRVQANLGNEDSMHVTNAVPQMQSFNGGIWLQLEDYALQNAREDDMRISVITGPVFREDDPILFGVQVPVDFWKVIAFVHDETGELSATGYSISQKRFLKAEEFVFGAHGTHQRSLAWIEHQTGLSFGELTQFDRFEDQESADVPITDLSQIRFF